jgi:hypothetical protein
MRAHAAFRSADNPTDMPFFPTGGIFLCCGPARKHHQTPAEVGRFFLKNKK